MDGPALHRRAATRAASLPGAVLEHPFGPEWDVWKVRGKVFVLLTEHAGDRIVNLKADPEEALALREEHPDITPGYHMNKKHWITLRPGGALDARLVEELVTDSYRLVVSALPRAARPVDPATFGV